MKRSGPPQRRTPLSQGAPLARGGRLRGRSGKATGEAATRRAMPVPTVCEVGEILAAAGLDYGCRGAGARGWPGWGWHERRKASSGGSKTNPVNLVWSCAVCNGAIEDHPAEVRAATGDLLVVREGDPGWAELGRRAAKG